MNKSNLTREIIRNEHFSDTSYVKNCLQFLKKEISFDAATFYLENKGVVGDDFDDFKEPHRLLYKN